jgi:hypothetical protein
MEDLGVRVDAAGFHEPLVHGCRDVAAGGVHAAGEIDCGEAAGLSGAVGALLGVVGALDDVAAGSRRVRAAAGGVRVGSLARRTVKARRSPLRAA